MLRARHVFAMAMFTTTISLSTTARADKILVYQTLNNDPQGGDTASPEAANLLRQIGHDVALVASTAPTMPDLSPFDSVWVIQLPPISSADRLALTDYARKGGGLFLTGENPCCEPQNASVNQITTALLRLPLPEIGKTVEEGGPLFLANPAAPFGLTTKPNKLVEWRTAAGGLMRNVPPNRVVFTKSGSTAVGAAAYGPEDFKHGSGCLYVAMDLTFWQPGATEQDNAPLAENIQTFLRTCDDEDRDGLSDAFEIAMGTNPKDADTDKDGLCDGYTTVSGVCIDGEHPLDDFDKDGVIPPLDTDDDNDGIPTAFEVAAERLAPDVDGDKIPTWNDLDSDSNFILDVVEGIGDYDGDGIPAIVDDGDEPKECATDADCAGERLSCNLDAGGYCHPVCRDPNVAGCSKEPDAPAPPPPPGASGDGGVSGSGAAPEDASATSGCGCTVPGVAIGTEGGGFTALALIALLRFRRAPSRRARHG